MSDTPSFASTREALDMLRAVMGYLSADAGEMAAEAQAECLQALEQLERGQDRDPGPGVGRVRRGPGLRRGRRLQSPVVADAPDPDYQGCRGDAPGVGPSRRRAPADRRRAGRGRRLRVLRARKICEWDDKLPRDSQDAADAILLAAARAGAQLTNLVELAAEIYARSLSDPRPGQRCTPDETFEDRRVTVETTFGGAGVLSADLTPIARRW